MIVEAPEQVMQDASQLLHVQSFVEPKDPLAQVAVHVPLAEVKNLGELQLWQLLFKAPEQVVQLLSQVLQRFVLELA